MVMPENIFRVNATNIETFTFKNVVETPGIYQGLFIYVSSNKNVIRLRPGDPLPKFTFESKINALELVIVRARVAIEAAEREIDFLKVEG